MKTIGFFGDSFISEYANAHSEEHGYDTYIKQLSSSKDLEVVHLGIKGSSIWDTYLLQLKPFIDANNIPDVTIISWTTNGRLFHRKHRHIHLLSSFFGEALSDANVKDAASKFYSYLYDEEKEKLEYISFLQYLDNNVFANWPKDKKVIHLWSFGALNNPSTMLDFSTARPAFEYPHRWANGAEVRPPLFSFGKNLSLKSIGAMKEAIEVGKIPNIQGLPAPTHAEPNHFENIKDNAAASRTLIHVLDNYESSKLYNF